jgi:TM2 domain-containing membrane protein YozV
MTKEEATMRGRVLGFDAYTGQGVLSGDDGRRYAFNRNDLAAGVGGLIPGRAVDFVAAGDNAYAIYPIADGPGAGTGDKNKIIAAVLAFFLGGLGIHKFYLGKNTAGVVMLLTSLGGLILLGIPTLIIAIIAFIEMIIYLVKSEQEFYNDYVIGNRQWF